MDATTVECITAMPLSAVASNSNSNTNMSCGSSSSSSNSSGYASATTTPTNPASAGSQYSDTHSTTPVGMVEPTPVATIAAVTPYYNETFQHQQHQQQPQLHHHPPHQQYHHQTHSYQLAEQLQVPSASQYNSNYDSYAYLGGGDSYPQSTGAERNLLGMRHTTAIYTTLEKPSKLPTQTAMQTNSQTANNNNSKVFNSSSSTESSPNNQKRNGETSTSAKPQATATPFYAQPLQTSGSAAYVDPYKNKLPIKLPNHIIDYINYSNQPMDATNSPTYAQNFTQYHVGGETPQEVAYGTSSAQMKPLPAVPSARVPQQRLGVHYGTIGSATNTNSSSSSSSGSPYIDKYDKYIYTAVTTATPSPYYTSTQPANLSAVAYNAVTFTATPPAPSTIPPQYAAEIPNDAYRKTSASSSWHWSMDYANGNCRSLPPPANGIPTAAIPPTNASYVAANATVAANRDMYYTPEKYSNKYDKYNSYYNPHQQYMATNAAGRSVWPNSSHASPHLVAGLADRLPHPYSHHAPLPPSGIPTAIAPPTHPSLAYHHPYPPSAAPVAARQNCCPQPYQQQNCYYARTAHHPHFLPNAYNPHAQTTPYGTTGTTAGSNNNNSTGKYGVLDYGHASKSKVNTNDLYAATPTYDTSNMNYHSYPASVAHNQQYSNSVTPAAVVSHQPLNPNITTGPHSDIHPTAYYNDLNMQTSYDTYVSPIQAPALLQQPRESLVQRVDHLRNLPPPYTQSNTAKSSLIDFRRSSATISDDCFMAETTLTNLDEHMATNMNHFDNNFGLDSEMHPNDVSMYSKAGTEENIEKTGIAVTPTTKTYSSLRDFLSTWNEDEEDYGCTDERKFAENESPQVVGQAMNVDDSVSRAEVANKMPCAQELPIAVKPSAAYGSDAAETYRTLPQPLVETNLEYKETFNTRPKAQVGLTNDSSLGMETTQYASINLPDIIIDIEKSNGAGPTLASATKSNDFNVKTDIRDATYDSFDVEKELDELESKKMKLSGKTPGMAPIRTGSVIMRTENETLEMTEPEGTFEKVIENATNELESRKTMENCALVHISPSNLTKERVEETLISSVYKSELNLSAVQAKLDSLYDRGMESDNTTSSNGSTFEKEYETFINKIGSEFDFKAACSNESNSAVFDASILPNTPNEATTDAENATNITKMSDEELSNGTNKTSANQSLQSDLEIAQKIKCFSKFYKRKRKYSESAKDDEKSKVHEHAQIIDKCKNFPINYTKRCKKRKEKKILLKAIKPRKPRTYTFYQRTLRSLRRHHTTRLQRLYTTTLIQQQIATRLKTHLPSNKGNSVQQLSGEVKPDSKFFNPKSLKCICVCFVNSEIFQIKLLNGAAFKQGFVEHEIMNTTPKNQSGIPLEVLEEKADIKLSNQTEEIENVGESRSSVVKDIFDENVLGAVEEEAQIELNNKDNRNEGEIETAKQAENVQSAEERQRPSADSDFIDVKGDIEVNKAWPNMLEMQSAAETSDRQTNLLDVSNNMSAYVFEDDGAETKITANFVPNIKRDNNLSDIEDKSSAQQLIAERVLDQDVDDFGEMTHTETEISANSPAARDQDIRTVNEVHDGIKNVIVTSINDDVPLGNSNSSPKIIEILEQQNSGVENVESEVTETTACRYSNKTEENRASLIEESSNLCADDLVEQFSVYSETFNSPASKETIERIEDVDAKIDNLACATKFEETSVNQTEENVNSFSVDIRKEFAVNSDAITTTATKTTAETKIEIGDSKVVAPTFSSNDKETAIHQIEEDMNSLNSPHTPAISSPAAEEGNWNSLSPIETENINCPTKDLRESTTAQNEGYRLIDQDLDTYERGKSVDMFGARKSAEYFTASSKNYFKKSPDFDVDSTDSNSSCNSDASTSSSDHRSVTSSSSSSSSSSDEDTQSSTTTAHSDFDEMKELEKELSQHQTDEPRNLQATEIEKKTEAEPHTQENYIKTLKEILESDSDVHDEVVTNKDVQENLENHEVAHANDDAQTSEHETAESMRAPVKVGKSLQENYAVAPANDDAQISEHEEAESMRAPVKVGKSLQAKDSILLIGGESTVTMPARMSDSVDFEVVNATSGVVGCYKSYEIECLEHKLEEEEEENKSQTKYLISGESEVPSLKKLVFDFLERENTIEDHSMINRTEDELNSKIPKLSDLCKIALSSSFEISATTNTNQNVPETLERELSVEEALAEMFRQSGVPSDLEDGDMEEKEAQDVVLINLEEILVNDSDLYVLQCDMNENVLSVVAHAQAQPTDTPMAVYESIDNIVESGDETGEPFKEVMQLESPQQEVAGTIETTDFLGPFVNIDGGMAENTSVETEISYTTYPQTLPTEFIAADMMTANEQSITVDSLSDTQFDFPAIHHEEIVSHNHRRLKRQVLYNSLREKYVLKRVNFRPHHGNRILKKYIHRWILQCLIARFRERELRKVHMYVTE
ncbi:serine-rich adhesin for platelets-like isoform X1 [Anastrepha obliqua]|uniref:serine-rich adhesin for platelets-like isoform X1 n=1 Tax=Anastrepha obliqua TaxID=95512 RepID=UPI0024092656|nr:serine-rich adhesin for platelets-like isoform X1 [Anastrepha obliqua]